MSWIDKLLPASFRGVPFHVQAQGMEFGRRAFSAEYPYRDTPFVDDMGRRIRIYTLEAFLIETGDEDDLFDKRDALIDALETSGPGTLVHPRFGSLRVQIDRARWRAEPREGNVERFSIDILEAPPEDDAAVTADTLEEVLVAADAIDDAQASLFDRVMAIKDQADHVVKSAIDAVNGGMSGIKKLVRMGTASADTVASLTQTIDSAIDDVSGLILLPRTLANTIGSLLREVLGIDDRIDTAVSGYRAISVLWDDAEPIPQTTPSRRTQAANQVAIQKLFTVSAITAAARLVASQASVIGVTTNAESPFKSADQAYAIRDDLVAALEAVAVTTTDVALFDAITQLQATLVAHIEAHGNALPRVDHVSFPQAMPVLLIAHRLDGTIDREADLLARNRVKHPLQVPADQALEVLRG